ncbi:pyridoxamine 5'-phosphate oxidase family protein [Pseudolysinimonas sp.]|uniref:pyridoxamine 5'-phosphate oxidase family protein n=1 Tax=Pseudolysinimonas sp. TaxID=2680009 RepID=UPI003F7D84A7
MSPAAARAGATAVLHLPDEPPTDPWELVAAWLPDDEDPVRPTMTLATLDGGVPDARTVLLSGWSRDGFLLHTDARSRKAAQLAADPAVALVMHLAADAHQLVVQGRAEPAGAEADRAAYARRSPYLQQLAWQNTDEFATLPLDDRRSAWAGFAAAHADGFAPAPSWIGYRVVPHRLAFWQGDPATASRRLEYARHADTRGGDGWTVTRRAG